ncbi:MAG: SAM-dependent methyltransferase [Tenericutes bacterium HGW-Tenericutes-1]|jgi:predicted O-methyltransferase YrrM|nr:MAG: SAM-dependent methyltransferase [Tenericutes bacterium HGW-Tenericutes-1]
MNDILQLIEQDAVLKKIHLLGLELNIPMMEFEGINFVSTLINSYSSPKVLEIGTAIGFSSIALSKMSNAEIWSIERNDELFQIAQTNVNNAQLNDRIHLLFGDAFDIDVLSLGQFDVIFIDAAKAQYQRFFSKFEPLLTDNGLIVTDNLSFHGIVSRESALLTRNQRALARKINNFINWLKTNEAFDTVFYTIGDGMSVSHRKRG